jgi:hypothetical protein
MKIIFSLTAVVLFICSCTQQNSRLKKVDTAWLDSIIKHSDSTYTKPYFRTDFVTATYYVNKKDSTVCQVMKDSAQTIRQVIVVKKDIRTFFAPYFDNGQLQADVALDQAGRYHGTLTNYYRNGNIENTGNYTHGLKSGAFKNYDSTGHLISTETYDSTGQLIK